jgi:hypothetical protein
MPSTFGSDTGGAGAGGTGSMPWPPPPGMTAGDYVARYGSGAGGAGAGAGGGDMAGFDAQSYLAANPDVVAGMQAGLIISPEQHWQQFGRFEGRKGAFPAKEAGAGATDPAAAAPPAPTDDPSLPAYMRTNDPGVDPSINAGRYAALATNSMPNVLDPMRLSLNQGANAAAMSRGPVMPMPMQMPLPPAGKSGGILGGLFG